MELKKHLISIDPTIKKDNKYYTRCGNWTLQENLIHGDVLRGTLPYNSCMPGIPLRPDGFCKSCSRLYDDDNFWC